MTIIEFAGLPGCGKTTLMNAYRDELEKMGFRAIIYSEATKQLKQDSWLHLLKSIRLPTLFLYLRLFSCFPLTRQRLTLIYKISFKISMVYSWSRRYGKADYLLVDHGILQQMVSLCDFDRIDNPKIIDRISAVFAQETPIDTLVFCDVDPDTALARMCNRNRLCGRIDQEPNIANKKKMYCAVQMHFDRLLPLYREYGKYDMCLELDARKTVQENVKLLCDRRK